MIKEYIHFTIRAIRSRKLRSWLTMLGIFIGIASIVSLISLAQGLKTTINTYAEQMGTDKIIITSAGTLYGMGSTDNPLTKDEEEIIVKVNGVKEIAPMLYKSARLEVSNEIKYSFVMGLPTEIEKLEVIKSMQNFKIDSGRDFEKTDKYVVWIGSLIGQGKFFKKGIELRNRISIEGKDFTVIGIMEPLGNPQDDIQLYIPMESARELFNEPDEVSTLIVQIQKGYDIEKVSEQIKKRLRDYRNLKKGQEDFVVQSSSQLLETFNTIMFIVQIVLIGIASISLVVGGIGIMNTMYTAVLERTREIGIMKAVGATNHDIMLIFLIESGILGLTGGIIGIILGMSFGKLVEIIATEKLSTTLIQISFPWYLIVGSLIFSFVVGAASGTFPAIKASKLKPVEALRYE